MFSWWMSRGGEEDRVPDGADDVELPETPAPVFAVRALKSAVWGTPAPLDEAPPQSEKGDTQESKAWKDIRLADLGGVSPTKPGGILLTPGIGATRRKNVAFGREVVDNEGKSAARKAVLRETASAGSSLEPSSRVRAKTSLTRTLENSRQRKPREPLSEKKDGSQLHTSTPLLGLDKGAEKEETLLKPQQSSPTNKKSNQDLMQQLVVGADIDGDITMDLNEPHSQSGKYWKSEYEAYQGGMKEQMEKLVRYKQLAKSYAKKKDTEATELSARLKEEQCRVHKMEEKMSDLSARIAMSRTDEDSPELIKELARQTALAVQFRSEVEEFRAAIEGNPDLASHVTGKQGASSQQDRKLLETRQELQRTKTQFEAAASIQDELKCLRQALVTAEKNSLKLQEENGKLTRELLHTELRVEKCQEKSEKQRLSSEEQIRKKDEALRSLRIDYDALKEQLKSQRRDSEHLLKKKHDQVVALRKELASKNGAESNANELQIALQKIVTEHDRTVADYSRQVAELKGDDRSIDISMDDRTANYPQRLSQQKSSHSELLVKSRSSHDLYLESQNPILSRSIIQPSKSIASLRPQYSDTPAGSPASRLNPPHPALSEITNNSNSAREHPAFQKADLLRATPLYTRTHDVRLEEPSINLPSPEPSLIDLPAHPRYGRKFQENLGPSMFNIPSSPPKPAMVRSRSSDKLSAKRPIGDLVGRRRADMSSSRLTRVEHSSSKGRSRLPPERAAAAKARLEQKNAEKKRTQVHSIDKENI